MSFVTLEADNAMESWIQVLDRERVPYSTLMKEETKIVLWDYSIIQPKIYDFVQKGGVCIAHNVETDFHLGLIKSDICYISRIRVPEFCKWDIRIPSLATCYKTETAGVQEIGYFDVNENRIIKGNNAVGRFPLWMKISYGKGYFLISSVNFNQFYDLNGSTLREIQSKGVHSEITERISQIDKGLIAELLKEILKMVFKDLDIPWIQVNYYPEKASSVFLFRMDLDGDDTGENIKKVADICSKHQIKGTFYANENLLSKNSENINQLQYLKISGHDIGNHCNIHNVFDDYERNKDNIQNCADWLKKEGIEPVGFVAPRGIWNPSLDKAIEDCGYGYSSDFGVNFNDLPYRPYYQGKFSKVLQIPVNPYCVGRAEIYKKEKDLPNLTDDEVFEYYKECIQYAVSSGGNGFIFMYGHPHGLGKRHELIDRIFNLIDSMNCKKMSVQEFYGWWTYREKVSYSLIEKDGKYQLSTEYPEELFTFNKNIVLRRKGEKSER